MMALGGVSWACFDYVRMQEVLGDFQVDKRLKNHAARSPAGDDQGLATGSKGWFDGFRSTNQAR